MTVVQSDPVLTAQPTLVKAQHLYDLRTAVNAVRSLAALSGATFTDATLAGLEAKTIHIQELRDGLAEARAVLQLPPRTYTDPLLAAGMAIAAVHVNELRGGVQ